MSQQLTFLDVETTGLDPAKSRIVEISIFQSPGHLYHRLINPEVPIPPEAVEIHGIHDEDVAGELPFRVYAPEVEAMLEDTVVVTYNGHSFDVLMVHAELQRAGRPGLDLDNMTEVDLYRCWQALEPRTLEGALRRYSVPAPVGARKSIRDVMCLPDLLGAMCRAHVQMIEHMIALTRPDSEVDRSGRLYRDEEGVVRFAFGKYKDEPVLERLDYVDWMLRSDFAADTRQALIDLVATHDG